MFPIALPLLAGAAMLLLGESRRRTREAIGLVATLAQLAAAIALMGLAAGAVPGLGANGIGVYAAGGWPAPFGIVLVVDRLSALMLTLSATLALASQVHALARWDRAGVHFQPLFQWLLMGLNGAFLTGDLFNLFVFFEVMLAASYGLMLHGSGAARVTAGLHYIAVNLVASLLFLIGVALIYGATGTLNMADLAHKIGTLGEGDRILFDTGAGILGVVFLIKAGAWPLNFWLTPAYAAAAAPVAAVFSIMTKVGVYVLLRLASLLSDAGAPAPFGGDWLLYGGLVTIAFGVVGMFATQQLARLAAYCVIISAGTLLAAVGLDGGRLTGPALFYLVSSVLATGAFFMLIDMIERDRAYGADVLAVTFEAFMQRDPDDAVHSDDVVGIPIPAAMAFLGLGFVSCALLVSGLPPLSGFVAKFALLATMLDGVHAAALPAANWVLIAALLLSGLAGVIALSRIGMRVFWSSAQRIAPRLSMIEVGPVAALLLLCVVLTAAAGPAMNYMNATAQSLQAPQTYIEAVLSTQRAPDQAGGTGR